jgi:hypothetical protein
MTDTLGSLVNDLILLHLEEPSVSRGRSIAEKKAKLDALGQTLASGTSSLDSDSEPTPAYKAIQKLGGMF